VPHVAVRRRRQEAERLRADFLNHFPSGIELSREVWEVLQIW